MIPRLQEKYQNEIVPILAKRLGRTNRLSLPRLEKIVVNMGVGSRDSGEETPGRWPSTR